MSITLAPTASSFPFDKKTISLPAGSKIVLGSSESLSTSPPSSSNGWFPPMETEDSAIPAVNPLPLSASHAEIWCDAGKVYINDLDSAFGTFVNGTRVTKATILKTGDTISLGSPIPRNSKTPVYITDYHLCPVIATISL